MLQSCDSLCTPNILPTETPICSSASNFMGQTPSRVESVQISNPSTCPVSHTNPTTSSTKCPVPHDSPAKTAQCPVDHTTLNPLNQMPSLSQTPAQNQTISLPLSRTESSIPRDRGAKWEYPSPQQFYNALVRKGWETPEEHIETMVEIHNFLNEEAWEEIKKWERRHTK
jgi:cytochrome c heme-lyase